MAITISLTSGTGYFGSTYTQTGALAAGQWYADETPIPGATASSYVWSALYAGKGLTFRTTSPKQISNRIKLFEPKQLGGLVAQFDTSRTDLITLVSGAVSSWLSSVGTWSATQVTGANRPAYSATARNGKPGIVADGVDQYLDLIHSGNLPTGGNCTIVAVGYSAGASANYRMLIKWGSVSTARRGIAKSNTNKVSLIGGTASTNMVTTVDWPLSDKIVSANYRSPGAKIDIDGSYSQSNANAYNAPDDAAAYIFRDASLYWNGSVQEILVFNRDLTDAERLKVEGYLASKWGLRGLLDSGHPYKSVNPPLVAFTGGGTLGAVVTSGQFGAPVPVEVSATLGAVVGSGVLSRIKNVAVAAELDAIVGTGGLTSFKRIEASAVLGALVGEGAFTSIETLEGNAVLGALVGEGSFDVESVLAGNAILGGLIGEGEIIVPAPLTGDIELGAIVGSGGLTAIGPAVVEATLGEIVGEGSLVSTEGIATSIDAILGEIIGTSIMTATRVSWLIVEDGTIIPDANSYASLSFVDLYLHNSHFSDWADVPRSDREAAIIRATSGLDLTYGKRYPGTKVSPRVQALLWPRKNAVDAKGNAIAETEIPVELKKAVAEAAYLEWLSPGYLTPNWTPDQLVTSETLGPLSVTYSDPSRFGRGGNLPKLNKIDGILAPILGAEANVLFGTTVRV